MHLHLHLYIYIYNVYTCNLFDIILDDHLAEMTKSSILSIILTHSVANVSALSVIRVG